MESVGIKKLKKLNKKEKKILAIFLKDYLPDFLQVNKINDYISQNCLTLLVDNRDYQIQIPNKSIINLLNKMIFKSQDHMKGLENDNEKFLEDLFVMPNKKFLLLKFISNDFCEKVYNLNFDDNFNSVFNFYYVPNLIFDLIIDKYQPTVSLMLQLFNEENRPQGLKIINDFIDENEESLLLEFAKNSFAKADSIGKISRMKNRQAIHFGYPFDYDQNTIVHDPKQVIEEKLPNILTPFLNRFCKFLPERPDQLTINFYDSNKGDHIPFHCDTHSMCTEWILSLSLGSDIVMSWRCKKDSNKTALTTLSARSLMIMSDQARYYWNHGIVKTQLDIVPDRDANKPRLSLQPRSIRYSFTFRKSAPSGFVCQCNECHPKQQQNQGDEFDPEKLETNFVHETYDQIANHFSITRYKCWPKVEQFLQSIPNGSLVLDVGCGNGRFLLSNPSLVTIGTDRSFNLLKICRQRNLETFMDDCLQLDHTLRQEIFDAIICIAVIHHMATEERRVRAVRAILNLLSPNGSALIYVWAFEQRLSSTASKYLKSDTQTTISKGTTTETIESNHNLPKLSIHRNRTDFREQDLLVPWVKKSEKSEEKFFRYYHVFKKGELEKLIEKALETETKFSITIEQNYYDQGNWCIVVRKIIRTELK